MPEVTSGFALSLKVKLAVAKGDTAAVRQILRTLGDDPRYAQRAMLHHLAGEPDAMYKMFNKAIDERDGDVLWILNALPRLHPRRGEPGFQQLLARIGLPEGLRK